MGSYCGAVLEIQELLKIPEYKKLLPVLTFIEVSTPLYSLYITTASQFGLQSANH